MVYTNKCTKCGLIEDEQRNLKDWDNPSLCTACNGKTEGVIDAGARIKPFTDGPNGGRMK